jgi:hypothetical protein
VGKAGESGAIPAKLYPVFRDRDELSSGADLSEKVQTALEMSDALVVVCSPSSVKSRWVNEEIRKFRSLGREDRIFCVIVEGDPQAEKLEDACFPPALFEGGVGEGHEPLAADARKWADGKPLARLKLVAGILGIRLDELRQREQHRKRISRFFFSAAALAVALLITVTVISRVEERSSREQAEALVSQVLEISQVLDSKLDLETLKTIGQQLLNHLERLDQDDLSPESSKQVALVLRQLGRVNKAQGQLDEAMTSLEMSRSVLSGLVDRYPEELDYIFELGNAEFYIGDIHKERLEYGLAEQAILNYRKQAEHLIAAEPDNVSWIIEMSSAHTNLAALAELKDESDVQSALENINIAVEYLERALEIEPGNSQFKNQQSVTLAWLADAQIRECDIEGAWASRVSAESLARSLRLDETDNNRFRRDHAYRLTGLAMVNRYRGQANIAQQQLVEAWQLLNELTALDPSNAKYQWELVRRTALIATLEADSGQLEAAVASMQVILPQMREALALNQDENLRRTSQFAEFLMDYSDAAARLGDIVTANALLDEAILNLDSVLAKNSSHRSSMTRIGLAQFQWRELNGNAPQPILDSFTTRHVEENRTMWSCQEANLAARQAILKENKVLAARFASYLIGNGFADPEFLRFCKSHNLCE